MSDLTCYEDLKTRGIIENISNDELINKLNNSSVSFYCGYDPTAKSLQIGNFFAMVTMKRLQKYGHKPYVLIGGATGMIGDPSGKSAERNLLDEQTLNENISGMSLQLEKIVEFNDEPNSAFLVNNYDWMSKFSFLDFMRVVGKHLRLTEMLSKESVKLRINSEAGISFTEFSYQALQGYDFVHLNKEYDVTLQFGGGDQWGNIVAGLDLTRKMNGKHVYGMVTPLVTDANGKKFGKSEGGATIYLDPEMTSPYKMYQYLLNADDSKVIQYLKYFSFKPLDEISALEKEGKEAPHLRAPQKALAEEVVEMIHGKNGLESALRATSFFFGGKIENISDKDVASIFEDVPAVTLSKSFLEDEGGDLLEMLAETPLFKSKGEAKRSVSQNGVAINNEKVSEKFKVNQDALASESTLVVRKGKKNYCVVKFT